MGKWCKVRCSCSNRAPLPGSDWRDYSSYCQHIKNPAAKTPEGWEQNVKSMYECGHRRGAILELWPGDLMRVGHALEFAYHKQDGHFEMFRKIAYIPNYEDEYLALTGEEVGLWELEIEQLQRFMTGKRFMGWHEKEKFEQQLPPDALLYGDVDSILKNGLLLCQASVQTGNPIEFYL